MRDRSLEAVKKNSLQVSDIEPASYNPRKISKEQLEALGRAMREFGDLGGIVVNITTGHLVGGHMRLKHLDPAWKIKKTAAKDSTGTTAEGMIQTPWGSIAYREVQWDEKKEKAANIAANKHGGDWDLPGLKDILAGLNDGKFDLSLTGFSEGELKNLIDYRGKDGKTSPDDAPDLPQKATAKKGDLWILGDHRLLCGDSTNIEDVLRVMDGQKAALVSTDPPYLVNYKGNDRPMKNGKKSGKDWSETYHEIDTKDAEGFYDACISNASSIAEENAAWYWWHGHPRAHTLKSILERHGILVHQQIIWVKPTATFGYSFYPWQHEPAWLGWKHEPAYFGWKKGNKPPHDGDFSHCLTSVWELGWDGKSRIIGNKHPTQKPTDIFAIPMLKHTKKGNICFEPFSGSGSQIIAGERLGRRVFAIEIEPVFVDVAIERWEQFTSKTAKKLAQNEPKTSHAR